MSVWFFISYQVNEIKKRIKNFLWSDGKGKRKKHSVKWEWCCIDKLQGGIGLKDLRIQGISLDAKWISKVVFGEESWKVLVRNNILLASPK